MSTVCVDGDKSMKILCIDPGADFSTADVFSGLVGGLRHLGHVVVPYYYSRRLDVMHKALQAAYRQQKKENSDLARPTAADAALWTSELAVTWSLRHEPDFVIVVSGMYFHPDAFIMLRRCGFKVGLLLTETPYALNNELRFAGLVDIVWTNERTAVQGFRELNPRTYYLPHAYNPAVHCPDLKTFGDSKIPAHDVVFVGTGFAERVEWLEGVDWTGIDLGLYGAWLIDRKSKLRKFIHNGVIDNPITAALYQKAKIGLNMFRQSVGFGKDTARITTAESLNPRSYELAACGLFHVSDYRAEVAEVFGDLVPTFRTSAELEGQLRRWLADDHGRQQVAAQLPVVVSPHSWAHRASQMIATIEGVRA
jgi:spore maturation protein CgeB